MSVTFPIAENDRRITISATAGQVALAGDFPLQDVADLRITKIVGTVRTVLALTTHYTLSAEIAPTFTVTLVTPAVAGDKYRLEGRAPIKRVTSIVTSGKFKSKSQDDEHDRHRLISQEARRDVDQAIQAEPGIAAPVLVENAVEGRVLMFASDGRIVNSDFDTTDIAGAAGAAAAAAQSVAALQGLATPSIDLALLTGIENDLVPALHCTQILAKRHVRVAIPGDSLATFLALENNNRMNGLAPQLTNWLKAQFPDKTFEFFYRAIGGMAWFYLNSIVTDYPTPPTTEWEPSDSEKWCETIAGLDPDLVIIPFGMNDGNLWNVGQFQPWAMAEAINTIRKAKSRPDVWLATNLKPSSTTADTDYSSVAAQEGRDAVAGYERTFAQYHRLGFLDFNRWMNLARDGRDVRDRYFYYEGELASAMPLTHATAVRDFAAAITVENIPADFFNPAASGERLQLRLAPFDKSLLNIMSRGGKLECEYRGDIVGSGNFGAHRMRWITAVDTPTTGEDFNLYVSIESGHLKLSLQGTEVFDGLIVRHGGVFTPRFTYSDDRAGPAASWHYYRGVDLPATPILADAGLWSGAGIGGNGLNHPNAIALGKLYTPVLSRVTARGVADHPALILLKGRAGLALDGIGGQYALVTADGVATTGAIEDIVTTWIGGITALPAHTESGIRTGFKLELGKGAVIDLAALWGSTISQGVFAVEAKTLSPGDAINIAALARAADFGPRIQFATGPDDAMVGSSLDDTTTLSAQFTYGAATEYRTGVFVGVDDCVQCFTNGRFIATDVAGDMPTGLNRLKLGTIDAAGNVGDVAISRIVVLPGAENFDMGQALAL